MNDPVLYELTLLCGPGSSVGIVTDYGMDGPGIEFRCRRDFLHLCKSVLVPTQPPVQWIPGFRGKKRPGSDSDHSPPSSAMAMKV